MITSSSIQYITEMLNEPQNITAADSKSINELIEAYPYFVPAKYMDAALKHKQQPYSEPVMSAMQLYTSNWLPYSQMLEAALDGKKAVFTPQQRPVVATTVTPSEHVTPNIVISPESEATPPVTTSVPVTPEPAITTEEFVEEPVLQPEPIVTTFETEEAENIHHADEDEAIILPIYTEDYFLHQGMHVSNKMPPDAEIEKLKRHPDEDKSLMVVMSFSEWLMHFKTKKEKDQEEVQDQKALKTMWQKEKLAAAMEEENEEIPENVFKMAVNSITKEDDLASESFAEVYAKQGRYDKAIDMYRKLSLRNPQKKAYFARKIEALQKEKQS